MIHTRNLGSYIAELKVNGTVSATGCNAVAGIPFSGFISNIYAKVVAHTGTDTVFDIHLNGTTIYDTTKLSSSAGTITYGVGTTDPVPVDAGDILSLEVDTVGSNPPVGMVVMVTISKVQDAEHSNIADQNNVL